MTINLKPVDSEEASSLVSGELSTLLKAVRVSDRNQLWVLDVEGVRLAVGGVHILRDGLAECWVSVSRSVTKGYRYAKALVIGISDFLEYMSREYGLRRIQCTCVKSEYRSVKFAKVLGFKREGVLRCYDRNGADHVIFSKIYA